MAEPYEYLKVERQGGVTTIVLHNPRKLNALNRKMQGELLDALRRCRDEEDTRVILLTGAGDKAFSVGADIEVFKGISSVRGYRLMRDLGYEIHRLMEVMEKPSIAAVQGYCLAGGLEIALACDFIIAAEDAQFGAPEINIGIIPGWGGCVRLARALGSRNAKEWIMTGKTFSAAEAKSLHLVNRLAPRSTLLNEARNFAAELNGKSPNALKMAKTVINLSLETSDLDAALAIERGAISVLFGSKDCAEGVSAFLEKREAKYTGE
ncbi:MAG: enoyl-CoA hydratase/isomerase family protein [Acidobacteriota bacterium]